MSTMIFYQQQAHEQQSAADAATLENVRERCQRAANAWTELAVRIARSETARAQAATDKLLVGMSENPDRGPAIA